MYSIFKSERLPKEIQSIGLLRGIAATMVCFYHLTWGNPDFLPATSTLKQIGTFGWTGVQVFFVISGFVIPYSMFIKNYSIGDFFIFLKKRIIRIEPPYLISILFVLLLNFISTLSPYYRGAPVHLDWINIGSHLAYLNAFTGGTWLNVVYWTLAIEFQYYLIIAIVFQLIVSKNRYARIVFFVVFNASFFMVQSQFRFIFSYSPYFVLGILLFQHLCKIISRTEYLILTLVTFALVFYKDGWIVASIAITTLLIIIFVDKVPYFLRFLGLISYSFYLTHSPVGGRVINFSENFVHSVFLRECMVFVAFAVCIVVSAFYYRFFEKVFKNMSSSIKYDNRPPLEEQQLPVLEKSN
jgi:peptidoglycan/LPS O-acetylase OafA/YrhL